VQKFGERAFARHFCLVDKHVRTEDRIQTTTGRRQNYFQGTSYYCDIAMNFNMSSGYVPTFLHAVDSFKANKRIKN
jgi:hypothetical protein